MWVDRSRLVITLYNVGRQFLGWNLTSVIREFTGITDSSLELGVPQSLHGKMESRSRTTNVIH